MGDGAPDDRQHPSVGELKGRQHPYHAVGAQHSLLLVGQIVPLHRDRLAVDVADGAVGGHEVEQRHR